MECWTTLLWVWHHGSIKNSFKNCLWSFDWQYKSHLLYYSKTISIETEKPQNFSAWRWWCHTMLTQFISVPTDIVSFIN
jgi:hypothetical protein